MEKLYILKEQSNYLITAAIACVMVLIVKLIAPSAIPFEFFEFWKVRGSFLSGILAGWPIFVWGISITVFLHILQWNNDREKKEAGIILLGGFLISAFAGITEEIAFRWLIFLNAIWGIKLVNFLIFGFAGFGVPEWFYTNVVGVVADFCTLGQAHEIIFHPLGWFVGSAILGTNAKFRDGHKYQGIFGWINSWFIGLYLFWIMFTYGLAAAIIVHFLYDLFIFATISLFAIIKNTAR